MKALVLNEYGRLDCQDFDVPGFGDQDVLIEVKACGICGSDVHGMDGSTGRRQPPLIMGHEASGVIVETGKNVTGWQAGDRVTFDSTIYCGRCHFCRKGRVNICDNRTVLGVSCGDYTQHGAFAQYVAVPQHILYKLPGNLEFKQAAMVEALSIAFHAVNITAKSINDTAVVVGSGMIGLLVIQTLRIAGCGRIIAVDIDSGKLDLAKKLGADITIKSGETNPVEEILKHTDSRGADIALEVVGISETLNLAVDGLAKGGSLTLVGNLSPKVDLPLQKIVTKEINVKGSCASCGEYPACLDMIARGSIDVDVLISAVAPLSEGNSWFQRLYKNEPGLMKVILEP